MKKYYIISNNICICCRQSAMTMPFIIPSTWSSSCFIKRWRNRAGRPSSHPATHEKYSEFFISIYVSLGVLILHRQALQASCDACEIKRVLNSFTAHMLQMLAQRHRYSSGIAAMARDSMFTVKMNYSPLWVNFNSV